MVALVFLSMLGFSGSIFANSWHYISFDDAMRKGDFPYACGATKNIIDIDGYQLYDFFKDMYEKNNPSAISSEAEQKIPKIIHQIWLGSPVPESFKSLQQSWVENHLGRSWHYKLWTDEDVKKIDLQNKEFYEATDNYGVKSDILRWEIVYHYGGVYVDMDFECLQPIDELLGHDFFVGIQPLDTSFVQLGAALFGSRPGHPILKHCIDTIKDDWHHHGAPKKTGPVHFTKSFYAEAGKDNNRDIAFPALYFYPLGCLETKEDRVAWIKKGAFAVHWWAKSWMPVNYRPVRFRDIYNDFSAESWNN